MPQQAFMRQLEVFFLRMVMTHSSEDCWKAPLIDTDHQNNSCVLRNSDLWQVEWCHFTWKIRKQNLQQVFSCHKTFFWEFQLQHNEVKLPTISRNSSLKNDNSDIRPYVVCLQKGCHDIWFSLHNYCGLKNSWYHNICRNFGGKK